MIIHVTSDYGQIGPFRWINTDQIPYRFADLWFIVWGRTFGVNHRSIQLEEVKR